MMKQQYLTIETEGAVTVVTLAREDRRNAISEDMLMEIENAVRGPPPPSSLPSWVTFTWSRYFSGRSAPSRFISN